MGSEVNLMRQNERSGEKRKGEKRCLCCLATVQAGPVTRKPVLVNPSPSPALSWRRGGAVGGSVGGVSNYLQLRELIPGNFKRKS